MHIETQIRQGNLRWDKPENDATQRDDSEYHKINIPNYILVNKMKKKKRKYILW